MVGRGQRRFSRNGRSFRRSFISSRNPQQPPPQFVARLPRPLLSARVPQRLLSARLTQRSMSAHLRQQPSLVRLPQPSSQLQPFNGSVFYGCMHPTYVMQDGVLHQVPLTLPPNHGRYNGRMPVLHYEGSHQGHMAFPYIQGYGNSYEFEENGERYVWFSEGVSVYTDGPTQIALSDNFERVLLRCPVTATTEGIAAMSIDPSVPPQTETRGSSSAGTSHG